MLQLAPRLDCHPVWLPSNRTIHRELDIVDFHIERDIPFARQRQRRPWEEGYLYSFGRQEDAVMFKMLFE